MNIKVILADSDDRYAQRMFDVLSEDPRFTVSLFTDKAAMVASLSQRKYDVIILDKTMADPSAKKVPVSVLLVDGDDMEGVDQLAGYSKLNKYQRVSETVRLVMEMYADATPNIGYYSAKPVKSAAVYSPVGGAGKSTVALSLAMSAVRAGSRAVYIGLEEFSSIPAFFGDAQGKGLSEIFAKLDSDINFTAKLQSLLRSSDGVGYFGGFDNPRDLAEVTGENIRKLLDIIAEADLCELVIFDLGSGYTPLARAVMEQADRVVLVAGKGELAEKKLTALCAQMDFMNSVEDKLRLVGNRTGRVSAGSVAASAAIEEFRAGSPLDICRYIAGGGYLNPAEYLQ